MDNTQKIILVGDGGVGKTTWLTNIKTGEFIEKYEFSMGVSGRNFINIENTVLDIWDCAGTEKFRGLGDGYYIGASGAIVMFDLTQKQPWLYIEKYMSGIRRICGNIPVIVCGNKCDLPNTPTIPKLKKSRKMKKYITNNNLMCMSVKDGYNIDKPINYFNKFSN